VEEGISIESNVLAYEDCIHSHEVEREWFTDEALFDLDGTVNNLPVVIDCRDHYEYLATYVDDILSFSRYPVKVIAKLKKDYILEGVGEPTFYLGGDVEQLGEARQPEGIDCALSANTYIRNAVEKVETMVGRTHHQHKSPTEEAYHPELDDSPLLPAIKA
jgi:hypothetical protein